MSLNKAIIMGRLTKDPELRYTQSGKPVASITLAVDRGFKTQDGSRATDFIPVVAWDKRAELLHNYFAKGRMAIVEGRLQVRDYTDNDGNKRKVTEIVADSIYFGDSKKDDGAPRNTQAPARQPQPPQKEQFAEIDDLDDGDLPF